MCARARALRVPGPRGSPRETEGPRDRGSPPAKPAATDGPSGSVPRATYAAVLVSLWSRPFVGLWGLPSLPTRTASWPSRPYEQVRPVSLTAFPGAAIRFPDSTAPAARSNAYLRVAPSASQGAKSPARRASPQVSGDADPSDKSVTRGSGSRHVLGLGVPPRRRRTEFLPRHAHHDVVDPPRLLPGARP